MLVPEFDDLYEYMSEVVLASGYYPQLRWRVHPRAYMEMQKRVSPIVQPMFWREPGVPASLFGLDVVIDPSVEDVILEEVPS